MEKILSDKALYDKKREAAQRMAEERYSDEVCAKALVKLYETLIKLEKRLPRVEQPLLV